MHTGFAALLTITLCSKACIRTLVLSVGGQEGNDVKNVACTPDRDAYTNQMLF